MESIAIKTFRGISDSAAREFFATNTASIKAVEQYAVGAFDAAISPAEAEVVLGCLLAVEGRPAKGAAWLDLALAWVNRSRAQRMELEEGFLAAVSDEDLAPAHKPIVSAVREGKELSISARAEYFALLERNSEPVYQGATGALYASPCGDYEELYYVPSAGPNAGKVFLVSRPSGPCTSGVPVAALPDDAERIENARREMIDIYSHLDR
jgi:hypothetical protein